MSKNLILASLLSCILAKPALSDGLFIQRSEIALSEIGEAVLAVEGYASSVEDKIISPDMHAKSIEILMEARSRENDISDKERYRALEKQAYKILSTNYQNLFEIYLSASAEPADGE